ncbi:metallophosphoesterase [Psychroserpens sp.]|uniref:metallophosphoesterase n=1 Tax=Psychroserpens sp. TaxID=2020870 RepID=UPI001B0356A2|nr:metallophosphoesterase [Psychroserpens sp.]MBO6605808.1 phosphoesterase [Psychroserpens sp.]MBO6652821.1 phosphoesterase [Psychroserpens sp.]MBO6681407.1 phosphoesterase [Psychroserpens sp.]MBO6749182.1 phosphoesterase [Psychroserpens sp.]MBO6914372.1 phosphoesterase [Psychroserpens sp.]
MYKFHKIALLITFGLFASCATYNMQVDSTKATQSNTSDKTLSHTFYLVGDAGHQKELATQNKVLLELKNKLQSESKDASILFLGDNVSSDGFPKKKHPSYASSIANLQSQIDVVDGFKGTTLFIPGNQDWYSEDGLQGLKRQEKFIEEQLKKSSFLPNNGCPIDKIDISDDIVLIVIDSQWYLEDWIQHPTINDDCEIKTRAKFFDEFEGLVKKNRDKTTLVALHHPMFSNGPHGGQYSAKQHLKPLPIIGSLKSLIRKTGGVSTQDIQNKNYQKLRNRIVTISQESKKVIFVSGHEHSLQFIKQDNLPQIISGASAKVSATKSSKNGVFSYGGLGYAKLDVFTDGSSKVSFYSVDDSGSKEIFTSDVLQKDREVELKDYPAVKGKSAVSSVYAKEETDKSGFFKYLWGDRYRKYYSQGIEAPIVDLDTLFGGLTPVRKGGGHQSKSVRLETKDGREFVMRAIRKSATQYIQAVVYKDKYVEGQFDDTYAESQLLDVYTASHPYAPFTIGSLSDAVGVYHSNPKLYYIPKQNALKEFNEEFGDELYMIEERAASGHGDLASFGNSNTLISTDDLIKKLRKSGNNYLDQEAFIKARLFDMLIGDWDRHEDQWRWAKFEMEDGKNMYRPVPRDRDQAFSVMDDGALLSFVTAVSPPMRLFHKYDEELKSPKWFNVEPYPLDVFLLCQADKDLWDNQVKYIQDNLTDEAIDEAFKLFPKEVQDETIDEIRRKLKGRRANLQKISDTYFKYINKYVTIRGTDKPDYFEIEALPNNKTSIKIYSIKKGEKDQLLHDRVHFDEESKEIWVYGLDGKDIFNVNGKQHIKLRIVGGQNNDTYTVENGSKVHIYDHKTKKNDFESAKKANIHKTDEYAVNTFDYKKHKYNSNQLIPAIGFNPDDGLSIGFTDIFTQNGFIRNPFTSQHKLSANYHFSTSGFNAKYSGEFAKVIGNTNLIVEGIFTDSNFADNFFGIGNETVYDDDTNDLEFYRIRQSTFGGALGLQYRGKQGSTSFIKATYESIELEDTPGRILTDQLGLTAQNSTFFERKNFVGATANYSFENYNDKAYPTLGMHFEVESSFKVNTDNSDRTVFSLKPSIGFIRNLTKDHKLVLASKVASHINFGDQEDLEIYQTARIGANNGLRGFNNERFSGKSSLLSSSDLRFNFRELKSGFLPLNIGFFGGFDVGRVWTENDSSDIWHTSVGGGFWLTIAEQLSGQLGYFGSEDGGILTFKLGFGI